MHNRITRRKYTKTSIIVVFTCLFPLLFKISINYFTGHSVSPECVHRALIIGILKVGCLHLKAGLSRSTPLLQVFSLLWECGLRLSEGHKTYNVPQCPLPRTLFRVYNSMEHPGRHYSRLRHTPGTPANLQRERERESARYLFCKQFKIVPSTCKHNVSVR